MRAVLLISHRDLIESSTRSAAALFRGLQNHVALCFAAWEEGAGPASVASYARLVGHQLDDFDACILFVRYRLRRDGFQGLRLWLEEDAYLNFAIGHGDRWQGSFPAVFHRDRFDAMVTTGRQVAEGLRVSTRTGSPRATTRMPSSTWAGIGVASALSARRGPPGGRCWTTSGGPGSR